MHSVFFYTNFLNITKPRYVPNGTYRVFFRLQTVCPTAIFNFPFSTFNFKKLPFGHNMLFDIYKLSARIGNGGSPCGHPMNAPTDCFDFTTKTNGGH